MPLRTKPRDRWPDAGEPDLGKPASDVVSVHVSDLHLSLKPPVARSTEPDWLAATRRTLRQLRSLAMQPDGGDSFREVPIVVAGDLFHRWDSPAELINFALAEMPKVHAVPGNHDLPHHRYADVRRSAYWTLVEAGKVVDLRPGSPEPVGEVVLHGYPWGTTDDADFSAADPHGLALEVAVIHAFCWDRSTGHPGADESSRIGAWRRRLKGNFHLAHFGDNHRPILRRWASSNLTILNPGAFLRRTTIERDHCPFAGLLHRDGRVTQHFFDLEGDAFLDEADASKRGVADFSAFVEELNGLSDADVDFEALLRRAVSKRGVAEPVKKIVLDSLK